MHSINPCVEILISIFPPEYCDFFFPLFSWLGGSSFRGFHLAFPSTVTYFTGQRTNVNMRVMPTINYIHSDCIFENRDAQQLVCKASHWSISHTKSRRWSWDRHNSSSFSHAAFFFNKLKVSSNPASSKSDRCHLLPPCLCAAWWWRWQ